MTNLHSHEHKTIQLSLQPSQSNIVKQRTCAAALLRCWSAALEQRTRCTEQNDGCI